MFSFLRRKKKSVGPVSNDIIESHVNLYKAYADAFEMRMEYEWKPPVIPMGSCSSYGSDLYEFVGYGTSGTNQYKDQYGRFIEFSTNDAVIICKYCGSKNKQTNFKCDGCGANL